MCAGLVTTALKVKAGVFLEQRAALQNLIDFIYLLKTNCLPNSVILGAASLLCIGLCNELKIKSR